VINIKAYTIAGLALAVIGFGPAVSRAQTDSCLVRTVTVGALTDRGEAVTDLVPESFTASLHKKQVQIRSVTPKDLPPRVMLLLDASGSVVSVAADWQPSVGIASSIVRTLPAGSQIGLVVFAGKIDIYVDLTTDRSKIQRELETLKKGPPVSVLGTALWDSVSKVVATEFTVPREGDSIYAITDGDDTASLAKVNDVSKVLVAKHIRLFGFVDRSEESALIAGGEQMANFRNTVSATGGYAIIVKGNHPEMSPLPAGAFRKPDGLEKLLAIQLNQISQFYSLEIELPESLGKNQEWQLRPVDSSPRKFLVTYPHTLASCSPPPSR